MAGSVQYAPQRTVTKLEDRVDNLERSLEAANEPIVEMRLIIQPQDRRSELFSVIRSEDRPGTGSSAVRSAAGIG